MKQFFGIALCGVVLFSCQENEALGDFTGNETTYSLQPGSQYSIAGTATIKERRDGTASVFVTLSGTSGNNKLPVHLHLGNIATPNADVAALLNPVDAKTGISETKIGQLADETFITYSDLINLEACLKIHLSDTGAERDIILAGGDVGLSATKSANSGRVGFGICKSE